MRHLSREGSACLGDAPFFQKRESGGPCAPLPRPTGSPSSGLACLRGFFGLPALPPAPPSPAPQGHFPVAPGILAAQRLPLPPSPGQKAGRGFSLDSKASPAAPWSRCPDRVGGMGRDWSPWPTELLCLPPSWQAAEACCPDRERFLPWSV